MPRHSLRRRHRPTRKAKRIHRQTKKKMSTRSNHSRRRKQRGGALPFLTTNRGPTISVGLPEGGDIDTVPLVRTA